MSSQYDTAHDTSAVPSDLKPKTNHKANERDTTPGRQARSHKLGDHSAWISSDSATGTGWHAIPARPCPVWHCRGVSFGELTFRRHPDLLLPVTPTLLLSPHLFSFFMQGFPSTGFRIGENSWTRGCGASLGWKQPEAKISPCHARLETVHSSPAILVLRYANSGSFLTILSEICALELTASLLWHARDVSRAREGGWMGG